jgi:poly-gamma-glutamate synthesis protein (capsule biosynthesis protein)
MLTFASVGQSLIIHDFRSDHHNDFIGVIDLLQQSDVAFTNVETSIISERYGWPTKECKEGKYSASEPYVLDELQWMGFNLFSLANNHAFDWGTFGVLSAIRHMKKRTLAFAGVGANLEEASTPGYLETSKGRVALVAMASGGLPDPAFATSSCVSKFQPGVGRLKARPGINPLRVDVHHVVRETDLALLKTLSANLGHETMKAARQSVGWDEEEMIFSLYGEQYVQGAKYENRRIVWEEDLKRNLEAINTASKYADYVFVYLHQHDWDPDWQKTPQWVREFAYQCIDAGATAFIGHGVPMLQGIEIYRGNPIVYSLGNFIFHRLSSKLQDARIWESVISISAFADGKLSSMKLHPVVIGGEEAVVKNDSKHRLTPRLAHGDYAKRILNRLVDLSKEYGTEMKLIDEHAEVIL